MMRQSDLELDKYWLTHSGYFRLATTVASGIQVLQMGSYYTVMAFQREVRTRKFQRESKTTGRFMNA